MFIKPKRHRLPAEDGGCSGSLAVPGWLAVPTRGAAVRCMVVLAGSLLLISAGDVNGPIVISQRGMTFQPGRVTLRRGDTVQIVNDDAHLVHHAYIESPDFSFDTMDQEPGSKTDVVFTTAGSFTVRCGIHPRMHLDVTVEN